MLLEGAQGSEMEPGGCYKASHMAAAGLGGALATGFVITLVMQMYFYIKESAGL